MNYLQHTYNQFFGRPGYKIIPNYPEEPSSIHKLPKELFMKCLSYGNYEELLNNRFVCKSWKVITDQIILDDLKLSLRILINYFENLTESDLEEEISESLEVKQSLLRYLCILERLSDEKRKADSCEVSLSHTYNLLLILLSLLSTTEICRLVDGLQAKNVTSNSLQCIRTSSLFKKAQQLEQRYIHFNFYFNTSKQENVFVGKKIIEDKLKSQKLDLYTFYLGGGLGGVMGAGMALLIANDPSFHTNIYEVFPISIGIGSIVTVQS
ncbi:MAG: hypothetical protein K0S74_1313 [Chlamydiales bacterium]|jgi:hypothetical protein|nr:hypothetical protein [Chlamydiales bacterium]